MAKKHNPFSVFRRNQKAWMAGLTLFTMFSFIALGSMLQCVGSHNQGTGPRFVGDVAKTQKFGTLDYNEFLMARQDMLRFETFLNYLYSAAQEVQAIPSAQLTSLRMQISYAASDAEALVSRWLVLKFAESEKLVPNEEAVVEYLQQLTQIVRYDSSTGTATNDQFGSDVLAGASRSAGLNNSTLSELVKGQIAYEREIRKYDGGNRLASLYSQTGLAQMGYGHGPVQISPSEALKAYEALHRMAKAKVAVFKASDYVGEVADPSDVQARAFYEQYKDVVNRADSKEPGFTQPQLLALEIVRADVDDALLDSITDEEVKAFYEEHKEEFRRPKSAASAIEEEDEGPAQEAVSLEGSDASLITLPEDAIGSLDEEAPALELPAEEAPAEAPVEEAPALELPVEEAPAEAPAEEGAAVYQKVDTLIAYQQEAEPAQEAPAEQAPAEQAPAAEAPAEQAPAEQAPAEEAPAEQAPAEEAPAEQAPAEEAPAEQAPAEEAPAEQAPAEAPAEQAPAEEAPAEQAPAEEAPAEQAPAEEAPAEQTPAEEAPAEQAPAEEAPAEEAPAEQAPAEETPAEQAPAEEAPAEEAAEETDPDFFPLSIVEGMIRRRIACQRLEDQMAQLNKDLQAEYRARTVDGNANNSVDMAKFAEDNKLQYHVTTSGDETGVATPIMVAQEAAAIAQLLPNDELERIFASAPLPYSPQRVGRYDSDDLQQSWNPPTTFYVYRVLESKPQTRLEYEDSETKAVNEETKAIVVDAYKLQKAAEIAKAKADEFAEKAKADGADFDALAKEANAAVVETEKFSWFRTSFGAYGSYAQPGEVREVGVEVGSADRDNKELVAPGWSFYETVFGLEQGGIGSCLNQIEDRAFVVDVVEMDPEDDIRASFDSIKDDQSVAYVLMWFSRVALDQYHEDFMKQLQKKAGFEWLWIPRIDDQR